MKYDPKLHERLNREVEMEEARSKKGRGRKAEASVIARAEAPSLDGFEYVPSIGIYVSKGRELLGSNWNDCQTALHQRGDKMLTIHEFVEFLKHLKAKNDEEARGILDEIYTVRSPWRNEWLDAKFENGNMKYHVFADGDIKENSQPISAGVLMQNKIPGINLEAWLNDNYFGLPKSNIPDGNLYYWAPVEGAVAWFDANSNGADLSCDRDPSDTNPSLGVRVGRTLTS
jgi:hypothetical protein